MEHEILNGVEVAWTITANNHSTPIRPSIQMNGLWWLSPRIRSWSLWHNTCTFSSNTEVYTACHHSTVLAASQRFKFNDHLAGLPSILYSLYTAYLIQSSVKPRLPCHQLPTIIEQQKNISSCAQPDALYICMETMAGQWLWSEKWLSPRVENAPCYSRVLGCCFPSTRCFCQGLQKHHDRSH